MSFLRELSLACAAYVATYMLEIPHVIKIIIIIMINVTILQICIAVKIRYKIILLLTDVSRQLRFSILKHNQQDAALYNILYCCQCCTCFGRFFPLIIRSSCMSRNSSTLAVATNKFDKYPVLHVQFLSSWWWAEKPHETYRTLRSIKNIVQIGLKFEEETSKMLHMEHGFVWCWNLDASGSRSEIPGKFWNVVLEKDGEDQLDRSCVKWRSVI